MNKRFLSTLLFGALFIASTSVFVSCKDYDDDIQNLQTQIDKAALKSDLDRLQKTLDNASVNAAASLEKLEAKLQAQIDEAVKKSGANAEELQKQIDAVKAAADESAKDLAAKIKAAADAAAAAQAAADKAQQSADAAAQSAAEIAKAAQEAAEQALAEAVEKLNNDNAELKKLIEQMGISMQSYVTAEELKAQIDELKKTLSTNDWAAAMAAAYDDAIAELYKAITSVELVESFTGYKYAGVYWRMTNGHYLNNFENDARFHMNLVHGFVPENSTFGDNELMYNPAENSSPLVNYFEGTDVKVPAGIVVRVNPINADIRKGDVSFKLIDSQGYDLDGIIEFGTPIKFDGIITRGQVENSGLWIIPVSVAEGVTEEQFNYMNSLVSYGVPIDEYLKFAIAINNTATTEADRYVTSTFDLSFDYSQYVPANHFTFNVAYSRGNASVENIHNRWDGANGWIRGEEQAYYFSFSYDNPELSWAPSTPNAPAPTTAPVLDPTAPNYNVQQSNGGVSSWSGDPVYMNDSRYWNDCLVVDINEAFTINGIEAYTEAGNQVAIDSIYVVLDKKNAVESAPSEINAWESYTYEGLNQTVTADKGITLKVTSPKADGDVIGFRVFAVNCDGTLVDPDGRAFYVLVTSEPVDNTLSSEVIAIHNDGTDLSTPMDVIGKINPNLEYWIEVADNPVYPVVDNTPSLVYPTLDYFQFNFFDAETKTVANYGEWAGSYSTSEYLGYLNPAFDILTITPKNVQNLVDNGTYKFKLVGCEYVQQTRVIRTVTYITLTKIMPEESKQLVFRPKQEGQWKGGVAALNNWESKDGTGKFMAFMIPNKEAAGNYYWYAPWTWGFAYHQTPAEQQASYEAIPRIDNGFKNLSNVFYNLSVNGQNGYNTGVYDWTEWDRNFEFIFKNALFDATNNKVVDLADYDIWGNLGKGEGITYQHPGYGGSGDYKSENYKYMLDVHASFIDGLTSHPVVINYVYRGVSTTLNADGTLNTFAQNYLVNNGQELEAIFACWHHANKYAWDGNKKPALQWTHEGNEYTAANGKATGFEKITNYNWYDPEFFGNGKATSKTFKEFFTLGWFDLTAATLQLNTEPDGTGQKNPYFVPTWNLANSCIEFSQNPQNEQAPIADHVEYLLMKVKDAYDHDVFVTLEVDILKPSK